MILEHCDRESLKVVLRSWLTMWTLLLLTIIKGGPEKYMGPGAYLADFTAGIEISGGQSYIHAFFVSLLNGALVAFAFLCTVVIMAINWRTHGYPTRESVMAELENLGICDHNDWGCALEQMQNGRYLSIRTTAVTIFGMFFSFTLTGLAQTKSRLCSLGWLLHSLTMIIVGTFNNFTPLFEPWMWGRVVLVPILTCYAVRVFFAFAIFPVTSNQKFTESLIKALKESSSQEAIKNFARTQIDGTLMRYEFSYSRLSPQMLREMRSLVQLVATSACALEDLISEPLDLEEHRGNGNEVNFGIHSPEWLKDRLSCKYKPTGRFERASRSYMRETSKSQEYTQHYKICWIKGHQCLSVIVSWLEECSSWRLLSSIIRNEKHVRRQQELHISLRNALQELDNSDIPIHEDKEASVFEFNARNFMAQVHALGHFCLTVDHHRRQPSWNIALMSSGRILSSDTSLIYNLADPEFVFNDDSLPAKALNLYGDQNEIERRDPDATLPRNIFHLCGLTILRIKRILTNPDLTFCIKRAWLTILCLVLYFIRPTAGFAYRNWLLWVAVLATYTVARYAVDGVYGLLGKCTYTFWGALTGMVAWYICRSNPFGYATVLAFVYAYIVYQRHYNSHNMPSASVVFSCTAVLVTGDSWASNHNSLAGLNLGSGFRVAWIRFVTVCIGLFISFLGTIFPRVITGKGIIRVLVANSLEHIGELQAGISNFAIQRWKFPALHIFPARDLMVHKVRTIVSYLNSAEDLRVRMRYEPPLTGNYPKRRFKLLILYTRELVHLFTLLDLAFDGIKDPHSDIPEFLDYLGWTDPALSSASFSLIYMSSQALCSGIALPSVTPGFLSRTYSERKSECKLKGYDVRLAQAAQDIVFCIYERLDAIIIIIKTLVGEIYSLNMEIYDLNATKRQ